MLRTSKVNTVILAYKALEGKVDYNTTKLHSPGTKAAVNIPVEEHHGYCMLLMDGTLAQPSIINDVDCIFY